MSRDPEVTSQGLGWLAVWVHLSSSKTVTYRTSHMTGGNITSPQVISSDPKVMPSDLK